MGGFSASHWSERSFSDNYLDKADIYILERRRLLELLTTLYRYLSGGREGLSVCDLGSGDGIIAETILIFDKTVKPTVLDASVSMLEKAKKRLDKYSVVDYIESDFERVISGGVQLPQTDFFLSSMAVHHLSLSDKRLFFNCLLDSLNSKGYFINIDTVRPPTTELEAHYFNIWSEWMIHMFEIAGVKDQRPSDVINEYKDPESTNKPDTIEDQLDALRVAGFINVDCFYKNGIFAIYMGQKP